MDIRDFEPALKYGFKIPLICLADDGAANGEVMTWSASAGRWIPAAIIGTNVLTSAHIFVGDGSNLAQDVAMTGDASIDNTGAVSVTDLTITGQAAGDILYYNGSNWVKLAIGTPGQVLTVNGGGTAPEWA